MKHILLILLFTVTSAFGQSDCPDLYPNNTPIELMGTVELCNSFFVIRYDKDNNKSMLVSERLRPVQHNVERIDSFRSDARITGSPSPVLYEKTGFDKGHMAPAGDATTPQEMRDTFVMTNMTPQKPHLNRDSWRLLEESVRNYSMKTNTVTYVVTIAEYDKQPKLMNGVPIPTGYWKIVYGNTGVSYYYATNEDGAKVVKMNQYKSN